MKDHQLNASSIQKTPNSPVFQFKDWFKAPLLITLGLSIISGSVFFGIQIGKGQKNDLTSTRNEPIGKYIRTPNSTTVTPSQTNKEASIASLDNSKKVITEIEGDVVSFHLDGSTNSHQLILPKNLTYTSTSDRLPDGTDFRISFDNGLTIDITRTPSVVHYVNRAYDYVEVNQWNYSHERVPIIIKTTVKNNTIYTETSNEDYPGSFESYRYYGFKLISQSGPSQNIMVVVNSPLSAPQSLSTVREIIESTK